MRKITEGRITRRELYKYASADAAELDEDVAELVGHGLWSPTSDGWLITHHMEWQRTRKQVLAARASAAARQRKARDKKKDIEIEQGGDGGDPMLVEARRVDLGGDVEPARHAVTDGVTDGVTNAVTHAVRSRVTPDWSVSGLDGKPQPPTYENNNGRAHASNDADGELPCEIKDTVPWPVVTKPGTGGNPNRSYP